MSDETREALQKAPDLHSHYCSAAGCGKWGGFGFSRSKEIETRWWCWEHYPHKSHLETAGGVR